MARIFLALAFLFLFESVSFATPVAPKVGRWLFSFAIKDNRSIPIEIQVVNRDKIEIFNHTERIILQKTAQNGDTSVYDFPDFYAQLHVVWKKRKSAFGYFLNKNKSNKNIIFFKGFRTNKKKFHVAKKRKPHVTINKRYKTFFSYSSDSPEPAVGLFDQNGTYLSGTFLTETGDYRFLSGNVYGNNLFLSCFDGSHLFLFEGRIKNDTIFGTFFSGLSYSTNFIATPDEAFSLANPYDLTYTKASSTPFTFSFEKLGGGIYNFPKDALNNKLTIVQIMGTWCPNCIDETKYYLELYDKYKYAGLNIVAIGFEYSQNSAFHKERLMMFQKRYNIPFEILIGGENSKKISSEKFPLLNGIISYPTSLFFDQNGKLIKTHTGFSGPGTGENHTAYKKEMEEFIKANILKD